MSASFLDTSLASVKYHIDNQDFDGPIDLLVSMVKEAKIDIMNIFLSDITKQYIAFINSMKELDYEYVAQYVSMAATLMEIKSYKLIPFEEDFDDMSAYGEEIYETEQLLLSDIEQRLSTDIPQKLKPLEVVNLFFPEPEYTEDDYKLVAKSLTLDKLLNAFKLVIEQDLFKPEEEPKLLKADKFTVAQKAKEITERLKEKKKLRFYELFEKGYDNGDVLGVFLSILVLLKKQVATAEQKEGFDIEISLIEGFEENKQGDIFTDVEEYN